MSKNPSKTPAFALPSIDEKQIKALSDPVLTLPSIRSEEEYEVAGRMRKQLKDLEKEIDSAFKPILDLVKKTREKYLFPVKNALDRIDTLIRDYMERKAEEARKKAEAERNKLLAKAEKLDQRGKVDTAQNVRELAETVSSKEIAKQSLASSSISIRTKISWEVVDINEVPEEYIIREPNRAKISQLVKEKGLEASIPGIRVFEEIIPVSK